MDWIHQAWVRDKSWTFVRTVMNLKFHKIGEIQKSLVELPCNAQGLSVFEVFSKFGDWLRYGNSAIGNKF